MLLSSFYALVSYSLGRDVEVTNMNIYQYVRKYAEYRMITAQEKALKKMREGLFDVIPAGSLDTLTAEDFRYLHIEAKNLFLFLYFHFNYLDCC